MVQANYRFDRCVRWLSGDQKEPRMITVLGGFPYLVKDSAVFSAYGKLAKEIDTLDISAEFKETTKLAVEAHYGVKGEIAWLSHQIQALTPSAVECIINGVKPDDLTAAGSASYDTVTHLIAKPGPLPPQYKETCFDLLGKNDIIGIIHLVGLHMGASMIAVAINAPVVDAEDLPAVKNK